MTTGKLFQYPDLQIGEVILDYIARTTEFTPGGQIFPCGDSWDFTCARCGEAFHMELPDEHPNPPGDCAGHIHVCEDCGAKLGYY